MKSFLSLSLIRGGQEDKSICSASTSLHTMEESLKKYMLSTEV